MITPGEIPFSNHSSYTDYQLVLVVILCHFSLGKLNLYNMYKENI